MSLTDNKAECFGAMGQDAQNDFFFNKVGMLNDMKIIGQGLVGSITVKEI